MATSAEFVSDAVKLVHRARTAAAATSFAAAAALNAYDHAAQSGAGVTQARHSLRAAAANEVYAWAVYHAAVADALTAGLPATNGEPEPVRPSPGADLLDPEQRVVSVTHSRFRIVLDWAAKEPVVVAHGDISAEARADWHRVLGRLAEIEGRRTRIDLSQVTFLDAGAIGALVAARLHLESRGGTLHVVRAGRRVDRLLRLLGLESLYLGSARN